MIPTQSAKALVKAGTFRRILADIRRATGLHVQDGNVSSLPAAGKDVQFFPRTREGAFVATGGSTSIKLTAGVVTLAGQSFYFPETTYQGNSPGMVALRVDVDFSYSAVYDGPDEKPWSILVNPSAPQFVWEPAYTTGVHARIRNPPDVPNIGLENYTLEVEAGTVYFPIAGFTGRRMVQYRSGNISLVASSTGALILSTF
jgi:hypothetical protein